MRRALAAGMTAVFGFVAAGLAGCTAEPEPDRSGSRVLVPGGPGERAEVLEPGQASDRRQPVRVTPADIRYMRGMIPHHEQAVTMTDLVPGRASGKRVRSLAGRIADAQAGEIAAMRAWLDRHAPDRSDEPGRQHRRMPGMATPEQLDALRKAEGGEFDRLFLQLMITHHEGALTMARGYVPQGIEPTALHMAQEVITTQSSEIEHMRGMLAG